MLYSRAVRSIGTPDRDSDISASTRTGIVSIWFGSNSGLQEEQHLWITPDRVVRHNSQELGSLVIDESGSNDQFGASLTAADFNDDGMTDLAIGVPGYSPTGGTGSAGAVSVIHGATDLSLARDQFWTQDGGVDNRNADLGDLRGSSFPDDNFGNSMP